MTLEGARGEPGEPLSEDVPNRPKNAPIRLDTFDKPLPSNLWPSEELAGFENQ
jgi:hypothetical protein